MGAEQGLDAADARAQLLAAVQELDGAWVREVLANCLHVGGVEVTVADVVVPVLHEVGEGWRSGRLGVAHEHFASSAFRGVLGELRPPAPGSARRTVVLACPPGELHDLPLELFGAMLHGRGWRVVVLGADTPMAALGDAVRSLRADACVLAGVRVTAFEARAVTLSRLTGDTTVLLAGEGALALSRPPTGCRVLPADLRRAADVVDAVPPVRARGVATADTAVG